MNSPATAKTPAETAAASGPSYPKLGATVAKFRAKAEGGLSAMSFEERQAYGAAVEESIKSLQRSELLASSNASPAPRRATLIGPARAAAMRASLAACPGVIRRARTDREWQSMYAEAMIDAR